MKGGIIAQNFPGPDTQMLFFNTIVRHIDLPTVVYIIAFYAICYQANWSIECNFQCFIWGKNWFCTEPGDAAAFIQISIP